jgi:hypothetical protein
MRHISGFERSQLLLLPEAVAGYAGADNPVRFIDAFADELDLATPGHLAENRSGRQSAIAESSTRAVDSLRRAGPKVSIFRAIRRVQRRKTYATL